MTQVCGQVTTDSVSYDTGQCEEAGDWGRTPGLHPHQPDRENGTEWPAVRGPSPSSPVLPRVGVPVRIAEFLSGGAFYHFTR